MLMGGLALSKLLLGESKHANECICDALASCLECAPALSIQGITNELINDIDHRIL